MLRKPYRPLGNRGMSRVRVWYISRHVHSEGDDVAAIGEQVRDTVRHRYDDFVDDWQQGQRHLPYTILAVLAILLLGAIIVPLTVNATRIEPTPERELLAERYVTAAAKVGGDVQTLPSIEEAAKTYGTDGGDACSKAIPALHADLATKVKGSRRTSVDPVSVARLKVAMRTYCPEREPRYTTWLAQRAKAAARARAAATPI